MAGRKKESGKEALILFGIVFFILAVYTFISLVSYLFTWASDQSIISDNSIVGTMLDMDNDTNVRNSGSLIGLAWSNFLVSKLFGVGAFIVPFFFGGVSLYCFKKGSVNLWRLIYLSIFGCIIVSVTFSYILTMTSVDNWFGTGAGGSYGHYANQFLIKAVGAPGAALILMFAIILWLVCVNRKVIDAIDRGVDKFLNLFKRKPKSKAALAPAGAAAETCAEDPEEAGSESAQEPEAEPGPGPESESELNPNEGHPIITDGLEPSKDFGEASGTESEYESVMKGVDTSGDTGPVDDFPLGDSSSNANSSSETGEDQQEQRNEGGADSETIAVEEEKEDNFLKGLSEEQVSALFDPRLDLPGYVAPTTDLLNSYADKQYAVSKEELERNKLQIVKTLKNFKIGVSRISARIGPTVTLYEIVPAPGVRVASIKRLETDIQVSLGAKGVRVVTIPGKDTVGIEVANVKPSVVSMVSCLECSAFRENKYALPVAIGKTISGEVYTFDLAKMPHLLVAGATGQGKSVGLNAILTSLLFSKHPSELKIVLVDPKKVEFSLYSKIEKHFLAQLPDADEAVITDTKKVVNTLNSLCIEMDSRYDLLKMAGVRNVKEYNEKFLNRHLNPQKGHRFMPYIVVVIDEFADLLMTAGREVEEPMARLAQLARAIGIHLVIATQRPTTSVITGNIKANFPARIAFMVKSSIDSKTILDEVGANQLVGRGDMLISTGADLTRVQCALIETEEVEKVVDCIARQRGYSTPYYLPEYIGNDEEDASVPGAVDLAKRDSLFEEAAKLIVINQLGSTSLIQRKMNLGYNRAGRIMDQLEVAGIVGPSAGSKAREVLVLDITQLDAMLANIRDVYGA